MWICLGRDVGLLVVRIEQIEGIEEIGKMAKACDLCHFPLSYYRGWGGVYYFTMPFSRYSARLVRTFSAAPSDATFAMSLSTMMFTSS